MFTQLKALVVVLTLASVVFVAAKPICLRFTSPEDFARRRMVWYVLTITAFCSPSSWIYMLVAAPQAGWAAKKDSSPLALYLIVMIVCPPFSTEIPVAGIKRLFELTNGRLMAFAILLPAALARLQAASRGNPIRLGTVDLLLLSFGALQLILFMPYESVTNTLRRGTLFLLDVYLVFFAFGRTLSDRRHLADVMGALFLSTLILAPIGAFESLRGWLLYVSISDLWGSQNEFAWLLRGDSLRAQASIGHTLGLGYFFAMGIGCWMYLKSIQPDRIVTIFVIASLCVGLFFTYSRGPWVTAACSVIFFVFLGSRSAARLMKGAVVVALCGAFVAVTPWGSKIVELLPFIGSQGQETVEYRQQLAEVSWLLIKQNPFVGDPLYLLNMEELRQGQGIIDIVNEFAAVALSSGFIGLGLFSSVFLIALLTAFVRFTKSRSVHDDDMMLLGASLLACMLSTLIFMATAGSAAQWIFAGLLISYAALPNEQLPVSDNRSVLPSFRLYQAIAE